MKTPPPADAVVPIAIPGIHERFAAHFRRELSPLKGLRVLEVGAGHGAFTRWLWEAGCEVTACDLYPEIYRFDEVPCLRADLTVGLPFPDEAFDVVVAVEVAEHIHDHGVFFRECHRVLKPGGRLMVTTPNILSLKSRLRFLLSGFFYSFKPLDHTRNDGLQHLAARTLDQYRNLALRAGFPTLTLAVDKWQGTSRALLFLWPFLYLYCRWQGIAFSVHNRLDLLLGRILFLSFHKDQG